LLQLLLLAFLQPKLVTVYAACPVVEVVVVVAAVAAVPAAVSSAMGGPVSKTESSCKLACIFRDLGWVV